LDGITDANNNIVIWPRQGVVAITLNLFRRGTVGFIGWLGAPAYTHLSFPLAQTR
jgi:hypothetical protein